MSAGCSHGFFVKAIEKRTNQAETLGLDIAHRGRIGAIAEQQQLGTVGILVSGSEVDRLLGGIAVFGRPMWQEACRIECPQMGIERFNALRRPGHDHGAVLAVDDAAEEAPKAVKKKAKKRKHHGRRTKRTMVVRDDRPAAPVSDVPRADAKGAHWVEPILVGELTTAPGCDPIAVTDRPEPRFAAPTTPGTGGTVWSIGSFATNAAMSFGLLPTMWTAISLHHFCRLT